jgi:hypothetical protein
MAGNEVPIESLEKESCLGGYLEYRQDGRIKICSFFSSGETISLKTKASGIKPEAF